mmetsp:Transcript_19023/g.24840  ORF Transcript_19023/g.24840 Transcript_19023/m.24840 type:complete len:346 (+) Transcript_19023:53-1090(+)
MEDVDVQELVEQISFSTEYLPYQSLWTPKDCVCALGKTAKGSGILQILQLKAGELQAIAEVSTDAGLRCGALSELSIDDCNVTVGDLKGSLFSYNLARLDLPSWSVNGHEDVVNSIDSVGGFNSGFGPAELVSGSRDGTVKVWDTRIDQAVLCLETKSPSELSLGSFDCWSVAFGNSFSDKERCIAAGFDNGDVKVFDLRKNSVLWEFNCERAGISGLEFKKKTEEMDILVATSCVSDVILCDLKEVPSENETKIVTLPHESMMTWSSHHLPQDPEYVVVTGVDGKLNLLTYDSPADTASEITFDILDVTNVSAKAITSFDWNKNRFGFSVLSCLDNCIKVVVLC